jgi:hypothetical protein
MSGDLRLLWAFVFVILLTAAMYAADQSDTSKPSTAGPPKAAVKAVAEMLHGIRIVDHYRWLEDGKNPETQKWVEAEMSYTRGVLDPLPGREAIHKRLTELLSIGSITPPQIAGKYYFYTRREGMQNQPVLYVRERLAAGVPGSSHDKENAGILRLRGPDRFALRSASLRMTTGLDEGRNTARENPTSRAKNAREMGYPTHPTTVLAAIPTKTGCWSMPTSLLPMARLRWTGLSLRSMGNTWPTGLRLAGRR